jgi:glucose/arabinose dehydrogenase
MKIADSTSDAVTSSSRRIEWPDLTIFKLIAGRLIFTAALLFYSASWATAGVILVNQSNPDFILETLAKGLGVPWGMRFINNNELMFTERSGSIKILNLDNLEIATLTGLPEIAAVNQGGLLDVAIGPNYNTQGWIYFTYSKLTAKGAVTTLARSQRSGNQLSNWQDLLVSDSATETGRHFGSRITFDNNGHVFFGIGDRGVRGNSQNLNNHAGTIMRLRLDGSVPGDNPFLHQKDKRAEIWSYGHRNPQGLTYDNLTGNLWSIEHGPRGGDEINLILKGRNYGWPVISYGKEYWGPVSVGEGTEKEGMQQPVKFYIPSIAPGSLMIYSGDAFPEWHGNLFSGALKLRHLNRVPVSRNNEATGEERLLEDLNERIRALAQSPEGWIYLSTDSGKIMRLRPR